MRSMPAPSTHFYLNDIREHFVHLADLRRDAVVDGTVADLDDEATEDVWLDLFCWKKGFWVSFSPSLGRWDGGRREADLFCRDWICAELCVCLFVRTYLGHDLHLLALTVLGLSDRGLESLDELVVEFLNDKKNVSECKLRQTLQRSISILPQRL